MSDSTETPTPAPDVVPAPGPTPLPPAHVNQDFPVPVHIFVKSLVGTDREVYSKLLLINHKRKSHTPEYWHSLIDGHSNEPAYKANPPVRR